jgi:hypothetical protein
MSSTNDARPAYSRMSARSPLTGRTPGVIQHRHMSSVRHNAALRQTIATVLAHEAGTGEGASTLPEAAVLAYGRLAEQLTPLIGAAGVTALAARSLNLAQRDFPWLAEIRNPEPSTDPFARVVPCLMQQEPEVASAAAIALLATFTELLGTLVGEGLTARLVGTAWASGSPDGPKPERRK